MKENIQALLISSIESALKESGFDQVCSKDIMLDFPTDSRFGDFTTNIALQLSKTVGRPPREIANELAESLKKRLGKSPVASFVSQLKVEGAGFINFYLDNKYFYQGLKNIIDKQENALKQDIARDKRVLIEFVSANPTGPLSVAHARQAAVGDSLANILAFSGAKVKREYYLNDEGNQINILGKSIELRLQELEGKTIVFPEECYQGEYIYEIAKEIKNQELKINPSTALEDDGEQGRTIKNFSDYAVDYILKIIKKELDDFGVKFDYWYSQKDLNKSGKISQALDFLKKKKFLYEKDGALWFKSTAFGDDKDRVVIKSDKSFTYLAPDIAYHKEKYKRGFNWLINLWGPDHHGYINRLKAAVQALGHPGDSLAIVIVQLASIFRAGKLQEMSTRRGQYITLREVLNEVGKDASRFFFLMRRISSHLEFDLEVAKKQTPENPVYYVQYAHARICSILSQADMDIKKNLDLSVLKEKEELDLAKKISQFSSIVNICVNTVDPYMLTVYLQELAESFHRFYDRHRVLGQLDSLTHARLCLIEAARIVIATGLNLLGVSRPEKM